MVKKILKKQNPRNYILFLLGINCGLRISDIFKLKVSDVKNKNYLEIREQKTGKLKKILLIIQDSDITVEDLQNALPALEKLSKEAKEKIPTSLSRTYAAAAVISSQKISTQINENFVDNIINSYNLLANYDKDFASKISDIMFANMRPGDSFKLHNLDYLQEYIRKGGDYDEFFADVLFLDADISVIENYCKNLKILCLIRQIKIEHMSEICYLLNYKIKV